eukprot:scaffold40570_cov51-Phaeocystis_antarctica.AAC.2
MHSDQRARRSSRHGAGHPSVVHMLVKSPLVVLVRLTATLELERRGAHVRDRLLKVRLGLGLG